LHVAHEHESAALTGSLPDSVGVGVFVLGMHRSGTSAVTRLISLLGLGTPPEEDLVQPTDKNPKGYWESEALVNFNERVLAAVGCHMSCPVALEPGWQNDSRLDSLREDAPRAVGEIFPVTPWVWKDPRHCLAFAFWQSVLAVKPVVVLVNRNPLEIAASAQRLRNDQGKIYGLALWERYLREALGQVAGLPVLVTNYSDLLSAPIDWCARTQAFLVGAGVPASPPAEDEVLAFVDKTLRHAAFDSGDLLRDPYVSEAQRALFSALTDMEGGHADFSPPSLPEETPTTEALLTERRRTLDIKRQLELERRSSWRRRIRSSRYAAPARPIYARGRRLLKTLQGH
jgi:hypothetical protein